VEIKAQWFSDTSIDTEITDIKLSGSRLKNIFTLDQIQSELGRFKTAVDWLCIMSDKLALENKRKKKLKGRLTYSEKNDYFQELLSEAEKRR